MKVFLLERCCEISRAYLTSLELAEPHKFTKNIDEADIICIIGCGYIKPKIDNTLTTIYNAIKNKRRETRLAVFGCPTNYPVFYDEIKNNPEIDYIGIGDGIKMQNELLNYLRNVLGKDKVFSDAIGCEFQTPYRANLVIQSGCSNRCAFCKSNYLNLHLESIPFEFLIDYIKALIKSGLKEIKITGLNTTDYGLDLYKKRRLVDLLRFLGTLPEIESIILDSVCLENIDESLLKEIISNKKLKRIMIPIQSMEDRLLRLMGKKYSTEDIMFIFSYISKHRPDIFLETIFMTTFPTETEETVKRNIQLLEKVRIHNPVLSVYAQGKNVPTLVSEQFPPTPKEERDYLLTCYYDYMIPMIEAQRKELLSAPLPGRLCFKGKEHIYFSTLYRFTTNDLTVRCPQNDDFDYGDCALIQSDFVASIPDIIYETNRKPTDGKVLKKLL